MLNIALDKYRTARERGRETRDFNRAWAKAREAAFSDRERAEIDAIFTRHLYQEEAKKKALANA